MHVNVKEILSFEKSSWKLSVVNEVNNTYSVDVGALILDLNPVIWKVINPFEVNCPLTLIVCEETLVHDPLKFATCEQDKAVGTVKSDDGMDTCKYPGA